MRISHFSFIFQQLIRYFCWGQNSQFRRAEQNNLGHADVWHDLFNLGSQTIHSVVQPFSVCSRTCNCWLSSCRRVRSCPTLRTACSTVV